MHILYTVEAEIHHLNKIHSLYLKYTSKSILIKLGQDKMASELLLECLYKQKTFLEQSLLEKKDFTTQEFFSL